MIRNWTSHLKTDEEKERFKREVKSSKSVLDRLSEILGDIENEQDRIERNPKIYDSPNWDYKMAHLNGYKQAISQIKFIINLDQQEHEQPIRTGQRPAQPARGIQEEVAGQVS